MASEPHTSADGFTASVKSRWMLGVAAALTGLVAARFALVGLVEAVIYALGQMGTLGEYSPTVAGVASRLVLGPPLAMAAMFVARRAHSDVTLYLSAPKLQQAERAAVVAIVLGAAGLLYGHHLSHAVFLHDIGNRPPPFQGRDYPFPANGDKTGKRFGMTGVAHFDSEGFRVCGPEGHRGTDRLRVTTLGDSMVYGLILDDPNTLCWNLREHFDQALPDQVAWQNMGAAGLSLRSYVENAEVLVARGETDLWIVGVLVGNDGQVIDLYTRDRITRHPLYILAAAVLDPYLPMAMAVAFVKIGRAEGFELISTIDGLRALDRLSQTHDVPVIVFFYDDPSGSHAKSGVMHAYVDEIASLADANPQLSFAGVLSVPTEPRDAFMIPDGHPNAAGNARYAELLAPEVSRVLESIVP